MSRHPDVVVVGGGVVGCAVAWFLAREGVSVGLLEREDLAAQASGAAAGMLLPYGENAGAGAFHEWGLRSLESFPSLCLELAERSGIDPELEVCGALYPATDADAELRLRGKQREWPDAGLEWLDARAAHDFEPALAAGLRGALYSPAEAHVRSPLLARAYAGAAEGLGARIERGAAATGLLRAGSGVCGVETSAGRRPAGAVVLCGGAWTPELLALPVEPVRGQIVSVDNPAPPLRRIVVGEAAYLVPKRDGSLVVGATEERVGFDCRVTAGGVAQLLRAAPELAPGIAGAGFRSAWAGLRPATPDGLPVIGVVPGCERLWVAAGHFRNGVLLSPATGRLVAEGVLGKPSAPVARLFRPERFGAA